MSLSCIYAVLLIIKTARGGSNQGRMERLTFAWTK